MLASVSSCLRTVPLFPPFAICTIFSGHTVQAYFLYNSIAMVLYRLDKVARKVDHNHELNKICNVIIVDWIFFFARVAILIRKKVTDVSNCRQRFTHVQTPF